MLVGLACLFPQKDNTKGLRHLPGEEASPFSVRQKLTSLFGVQYFNLNKLIINRLFRH